MCEVVDWNVALTMGSPAVGRSATVRHRKHGIGGTMTSYTTITVEPLTAAIGAVIGGVDATQPLTGTQVAEIRRALLDHLVVFLRDQDLSEEQQLAFAANFGPLNPGSIDPRPAANPSMFV